jgi:primosomal protein N' (replication factor Y)
MTAVLRVALPVPIPALFDYLPPDEFTADASWVGVRVAVRFGSRRLVGVVAEVGVPQTEPSALRRIERRIDAAALVTAETAQLLAFTARYYAAPIGEVYATALPKTLRSGRLPPATRDAGPYTLSPDGAAALAAGRTRAGSATRRLLARLARAPAMRAALEGEDETLARALAKARRLGWIVAGATARAAPISLTPALNPQQRDALQAIGTGGGFRVALLDGVTGSGKTEVYLALISAALARGEQCLVLVPEISLTPQLMRRFRSRLGIEVPALHSALADGERAALWLGAARGEIPVLIGTRSAVFVPLARPGAIVIDEEHDASYKQHDGVRYHARDLAIVRARALDIPVVLGSATPALETLANATAGRYRHVVLARRAVASAAPRVRLVDLRRQSLADGLAPETLAAMRSTLGRGEQVLVFRNRRGYAPALVCHDCGWHADCERCDRAMVMHRAARELRCHHCGASAPLPAACPSCASLALEAAGAGTERIESGLAQALPEYPIVRVDRDTTRRRGALEELLALPEGPAVLVGTQMLAKGHDLPRLTLAVIANVDDALYNADFRATERLAQLVIQVAGRAGRGERQGLVLLQTHEPDHALLQTLIEGGYAAFAAAELAERRALGLPPFSHFALLRAEASDAASALDFLASAKALVAPAEPLVAHGPLPAPMPRRADLLRFQLLLECAERAPLQGAIKRALPELHALREARRVRWSIDVDPVDLG